MKKLRRPKSTDAIIPTASMADIAFLLIIFFMVTTTHEVDRTSVNLPAAKIRVKAEAGAPIVVLVKDASGLHYKFSNGEDMSHAVLRVRRTSTSRPRVITYADPTQAVRPQGGRRRAFELIDELLDPCARPVSRRSSC